jgi:ubiquinone/menaquinone biosynthesis C-methylase UbiE
MLSLSNASREESFLDQPRGAKAPSGLKPAPQVYDRIAPVFGHIADRRRAYLDAVDRIVIAQIPPGSRSLLDVGAGDGSRACKIAKAAGIGELVLLEPSAEMRKQWPSSARGWSFGAEDLCSIDETFDTIVCLWNVLGHISPAEKRAEALRQFSRLLSPSGMVVLDVNHRYNMREYGVLRTVARTVRDWVLPSEHNGDVVARWQVNGAIYETGGHVFTDREFRMLVASSGLRIAKRFVVDYKTGQVRKSGFSGNLLYCLAKSSANFGDSVLG